LCGKSFFLEERRKRKVDLLDLIGKSEGKTDLNKLKGVFSLKTGLSFKKIDEYLAELHIGGLIHIDYVLKTVKVV